jgi:hypothetical protein
VAVVSSLSHERRKGQQQQKKERHTHTLVAQYKFVPAAASFTHTHTHTHTLAHNHFCVVAVILSSYSRVTTIFPFPDCRLFFVAIQLVVISSAGKKGKEKQFGTIVISFSSF